MDIGEIITACISMWGFLARKYVMRVEALDDNCDKAFLHQVALTPDAMRHEHIRTLAVEAEDRINARRHF